MLPAPASTAAVPSPRSRASCNPAVPPPPVGGATVGISLVDEVPEAVVLPDVTPEEGVKPPEAVAVAVLVVVTDGVKVGTVGVEEDPLQAETATGARRVRAPQHTTVSLARRAVPAIVVGTFMEPPHAPGS